MSKGIVWLASFPKSGNTWLRAFLKALVTDAPGAISVKDIEDFCLHDSDIAPFEDYLGGSVDGMSYEEIRAIRPAVQRFIVDTLGTRVLIKTHSDTRDRDGSPAINPDVTAGAVVVVRNPLDIVPSHADHYGVSMEQAVSDIGRPRMATGPNRIPVFTGSWASHTDHWVTGDLGFKRVVLRYEDMHDQPLAAFGLAARFLGVRDEELIRRAIERTSFADLQSSEEEVGFGEKSPKSRRFFRQGMAGTWRKTLPSNLVKRLIESCAEPMHRLGYIDDRGDPV